MSVLRKTAGTVLAGGAQVLSAASKLMESTARTLHPSPTPPRESDSRRPGVVTPPSDAAGTADVLEASQEQAPQRGRIVTPPPTPVLDETPHVRTSETHVEELADMAANEVIAAVAELSTDELRLLTEHELAHKNRKTVLTAIEKALTPSSGSTSGNAGGSTRGQRREIVLPEAGGVPTSGTMQT
jgi:hypothetical protein